MLYTTLKFLHILFAIVAVGFNTSFGLILGRASKGGADGREMKFALGTVRAMAITAHALYLLVLATGVVMVYLAGYPWSLKWIHGSLALFVIAFLAATVTLLPMMKRRIAIVDARGPADPEFLKLSKRSAMIAAALTLITLVILWLMVAKPA
jgi:uncharacterized membrane protein